MTEEEANNKIDNLIRILDTIDTGRAYILTGSNGSGKSLLRKLLASKFIKETAAISMESRTTSSSWGMDRVVNSDCDWLATSENTIHFIQNLLDYKERFLILDEPEIGLGEELQLGTALYINENLEGIISRNKGLMIITHSRKIVESLEGFEFLNTDGLTKEEWLNREVKPVKLDEFRKNLDVFSSSIRERLKCKKR